MNADKYIIAHDLGTSCNKAVLISVQGKIIAKSQKDYTLSRPKPTFVEQDPFDWVDAVSATTRQVIHASKVDPVDIVGITFLAQTQTLVPVERDGTPLLPAISWLDTRGARAIRQKLWTPPRMLGYNIHKLPQFLRICGGAPGHTGKDPLAKVLWMQEAEPKRYAQTYKFLGAKDFVIYHLTGEMVKSVDTAVLWWLLDTRKNKNEWSPRLCRLSGVPMEKLPEVMPSASQIGTLTAKAAQRMGLQTGTPVINGAGDIAAAALGSGAIEDGEIHIRIGTCGGIGGHFRHRKIDLPHYAGCIGSVFPEKYFLAIAHQENAGLCLSHLKSTLFDPGDSDYSFKHLDELAATVPAGSEGLIFTPWLSGERTPLNDTAVRGGFFNLGLNQKRGHWIRAILEGVAYNTRWGLEVIENMYQKVPAVNFVGGGANSKLWAQIMADVTGHEIRQVADPQESSAKGIGLLASHSLGFLNDIQDIKNQIPIQATYQPNVENHQLYNRLFREFKNLYQQNRNWYHRMNQY